MAYNFPGMPATAMAPMGLGPMGPLGPLGGPQGFMELASQGFPPLPPPLPLPGMNDNPLEFSTKKNQPPIIRETVDDTNDRRSDKSNEGGRRDRDTRDNVRESGRRTRLERGERRERDRDRRADDKTERERRENRRLDDRSETNSTGSSSGHGSNGQNGSDAGQIITNPATSGGTVNVATAGSAGSVGGAGGNSGLSQQQIDTATGVWGMGVGYPMMGMSHMGPMGPMMNDINLAPHLGRAHGYGPMGMGMMSHENAMLSAQMIAPEQIMSDTAAQLMSGGLPATSTGQQGTKEIIHRKSCTLFPPNPNAPPPTTRERPPGCRTIFVGEIAGYSGEGQPKKKTLDTDIDSMFTTSAELMDIKAFDKTVEIIGYVDYIVPSRNVRQNELRVFKFVLNNGDRQRIQVNAWNTEISRTESVIKLNSIVHLDSAFAKICTKQAFNDGTVNTELIIESYTVINVLGQRNSELNAGISEMAPIVMLEKIENTSKFCRLEGYIKSNFYLLKRQNGRGINFGCGSMTNGNLKIEVHVQNFNDDHDFRKGDHITAYGYLKRHGLPENITEPIMQEIFERCGEITTLRLSKKNFCHIRFVLEASVDAAIYMSGYRVRIGSNGDAANTGRLHVDFAQARDDQYEWECRQRQLQREQRHRERVEKERQRPPSSPPPVVHYTDHEASSISEKIKQDDTFMKAVQVVVTWLERGDCTKRNANTFYSMIQSTNSHVRRLLTEKVSYEEELQRAKELLKGRMQGLLIQFSQIERVFTAASHKKVWDHFTKAQRKNIEMWKKQSSEIKAVQLEEETLMEGEDEMEVSDSEDEPQRKKIRSESEINEESEKFQALKDEADSLRCQLEAYKNEVDLLKSETKAEIDAKDKQTKMLQQNLKGMQDQLLQSRKQQIQDEQRIKELVVKLNVAKMEEPRESEVITLDKDDDVSEEPRTPKPLVITNGFVQITQKDAKLIGLIATFLHIHPFGASVDYVWSYLQKMEPGIRPNEVEALMQRFPQVFKQELSGIGANMERRWQFSGFNVYRNH